MIAAAVSSAPRDTAWRLLVEPMEPRILHSADLAPLLWSGDAAVHGITSAEAPASVGRSEIVFVDAGLPDAQLLIADLQAQRDAGRPLEIVSIPAGSDGLALISDTLAGRHDIDAVHILAHGSDARLQLGSSVLDSQTLLQQAGTLAGWADALSGDADLLLYGCDLAQSALGRQLVQDLAALTGADVAASTDLTGAAAYGGNWLLEYQSGSIEAMLAPSRSAQAQWTGVLATYSVTSTADFVGAAIVPGTLRWAISQANANPGSDTITFAVNGRFDMAALGSGDDNNSAGDFDITGSLRITGNGSANTVINGNGLDRVFDVRAGTVSLSGLTVQGGASNAGAGIRVTSNANLTLTDAVVQGNFGIGSSQGGGIYNAGALTLLRVAVQDNGNANSGDVDGAGIYNAGQATLDARETEIRGNVAAKDKDGGGLYLERDATAALQNVTLAGNQARRGGGAWNAGGLSLINVTVSGNTASSEGGGLWTDKGKSDENNGVALSLDHVTVAGNSAASGGGVYRKDSSGDISVGNSLFAANSGGNTNRSLNSRGYNLSDDGSAGFSATGDRSNISNSLIALGSLASNGGFGRTMALGAASVALDAANPATSLAADQRGTAYSGLADIGAYEFNSVGLAPTITTLADLNLAEDGFSGAIAFTVADAQSAAASLIVSASSSNAALLPSASLLLGGSNGARNLSFTPLADASGTTTITLTVSDGLYSASSSFSLTVQAVNDAPVLSVPGTRSVNEDGVLNFNGGAALIVGDVDAGNAPLQLSLSVAQGSLSLGSTTGLAFVSGNGTNDSSMTFAGSQSAINAALASLQYRPAANFNGSDSLAVTVSDLGNSGSGGARSSSSSVAITVDPVNDAPSLSLPGAQSTPLLTPLQFSSAAGNAIRVADIDGAGLPLQLSLTTANLAGGGRLSFGSLAGLTLVSGTGTLDSTVVLRGNAADLNAALDTLGFRAGIASSSRLDIGIDDLGNSGLGGARQASGAISIAIGADALPVVNLGTPAASYTEHGATLVLLPTLTLSDADNTTLASAQLRIGSAYAGAQDQLRFVNDGATMGNIVGSYNAGVLSLGSAGQSASVAEWQAALRAVGYDNTSSSPSTAARGFTLSVNDGIADSAARQWTLGVVAVNDAPVLDGVNDFAAVAEDASNHNGTPVSSLLAGHLVDADQAALAGIAIVAIDNSHGSWQYTLDGGASWQAIGSVSDASALLLAADAGSAVRFTPAPDWNGTLSGGLRLRAWDQTSDSAGALADTRGNGGSSAFSAATFASSITVTAVNDAPQLLQPIADLAAIQHSLFGFSVPTASFTDIDAGDTLSYSAALASGAALPAWLRFDAASLSFAGTPGEMDVAVLTLRLTATDASGASAVSNDFQLTVIDLNDEPVLAGSVADQFATERQPFAFSMPAGLFTDINVGDTLGYTATLSTGAALPAWLRFDSLTQTLSGTPANADVGPWALRLVATDSSGAQAHADFMLSVANVNDAPVLAGTLADQGVSQGNAFGFTLPAGLFTDIDVGDSLIYTASAGAGAALPAWLRFDALTQTFSGTPANADVGAITLTVTATDAGGASASGSFNLTVDNLNDAPVLLGALADQRAVQGGGFALTLPAGLFADIDVGDSLGFSATLASGAALPAWLRFDAASQTFSGTPANADVGALALRVTATDASGASASGSFNLTVDNLNDAPVLLGALADQRAVQGGGFTFALPTGLFANIDAGNSLGFSATLASGAALPAWLRFDAVTQTFNGTPANADVGALALRVTATDASGASASASFTLSVDNLNDAPVLLGAMADQRAVQGGGFTFALPTGLFADIDVGDSLGFTATLASGAALPAWLRFDAVTQTFGGTPANADVGALSIRVSATDAAGATASGSFSLTVDNLNDAPLLTGSLPDRAALQGEAFSFTLPAQLFTDIDANDSLSYDAKLGAGGDLPAWLRFDAATQTFSGTPANVDVGALSLRIKASDTSGATASANFMLTVLNVNDAPTAVGVLGDRTAQAGSPMQFALPQASFVDVDAGDELRYAATLADGTKLPGWLSFDPERRLFTAAPEAGDVGQLLVRVTATDAAGARAQALFAFSVVLPPAAPAEPAVPAVPVEPTAAPTPVAAITAVEIAEPVRAATPQTDKIDTAAKAPVKAAEPRPTLLAPTTASPVVLALDARPTTDTAATATEARRQDLSSEAASAGVRMASRADAVLAAALVPQYADLNAAPLMQLLRSDDLLRKLDELQRQLAEPLGEHRKLMASSIALTGGLSIGYVVWLVRGGVLVSSMLSALPAWQMIDPLPVLAAAGAAKRRRADRASLEAEPELERLFDEHGAGADPAARPAELPPKTAAAARSPTPLDAPADAAAHDLNPETLR
ncbi:hypothetical protein BH11PSE10_BH11PSE10_14400 [soil metagenome]